MNLAVLGDQVDILHDDHGRLQRAGHRAGGADQVKSLTGQLDDRHVGELAEEVTQRVSLPDARWTVEQEAPLEVLPCGEQPFPMVGHPDHLPAYRRQNLGGQNDVGGAHLRAGVELQHRTAFAEHVMVERDHLAAEDVVVQG